MMTELEQYLTTASSENLLNYYNYYNKLKEETAQISTTTEYDFDKLLLKDIKYMLDELMVESDLAIKAREEELVVNIYLIFKGRNKLVIILNYTTICF